MGIWDVNQTLLPCPNDSNWTLQQQSWKVRVELMSRKCLNWSTTLIPGFIVMLLWPRWNNDFGTSGAVWPIVKVEVWVEYNKLYFWTKPWFNTYVTQTLASSLNAVLLWALRNLSKSLIGNSGLICCDIFIFQIHMVTQLDSLIWVEVHFVLETLKQVSSSLEFIWIFEVSFKISKD